MVVGRVLDVVKSPSYGSSTVARNISSWHATSGQSWQLPDKNCDEYDENFATI